MNIGDEERERNNEFGDEFISIHTIIKIVVLFVIGFPLIFFILAFTLFFVDPASRAHTTSDPTSNITMYLADDAPQENIDQLMQYIDSIEGVREVSFTTKDEALEDLKESTTNQEIIDQLDGANPLSASINIKISKDKAEETISLLENNELFIDICPEPDNSNNSIKYSEKTLGSVS